MKSTIKLSILPLIILIAGCAASSKYNNARFHNGKIYPFEATRLDTGRIYNNIVQGKPYGEKPNAFDFFVYSPYMIPFYIVDTPISLVADIITLPYDFFYIGETWESNDTIENSQPEPHKED